MVDESRKTGKAFLVDVKTYRYKGHSMSDPAKYRTKDELESFKNQDPIISLKDEMIEAKMISEEEYKAMDDEVKAEVNEAIDFAEKSPEPPMHTMYEDIYAE
jgi:pyruvate dehydrogenase E1 component alpha subunit